MPGLAVVSFTTATSNPCPTNSRRWASTQGLADTPARMTLLMYRLRRRPGYCSPVHRPWGGDHDSLAVLDGGLVALHPVGPRPAEAFEAQRTAAIEHLGFMHHPLASSTDPPGAIGGVVVWSASRPSLYGTLRRRPNQKREDLEANLTRCRRRLALRYKGRGAVAEARADGDPNPRADNLRRPD
jgi:hypothetical protein